KIPLRVVTPAFPADVLAEPKTGITSGASTLARTSDPINLPIGRGTVECFGGHVAMQSRIAGRWRWASDGATQAYQQVVGSGVQVEAEVVGHETMIAGAVARRQRVLHL